MKIPTPKEIKICDDYAIKHLPISSIDLMERAAVSCVEFITNKLPKPDKVYIFCGKGNNGGDGLAIARLLIKNNYSVQTFIVEHSANTTIDFDVNRNRLDKEITSIKNIKDLSISSTKNSLIIDAIIGNGLNKPLDGIIKDVVAYLNKSEGVKLAIDIPTGFFADIPIDPQQTIFQANHTLSFQVPKLNFMFKENYPFVGDFTIMDIGWPDEVYNEVNSNFYFTTGSEIKGIFRKREKFESKNDFGHALIIAGSYGKIGAALLATKACLRSGAGLTTTYSPKCAYTILQSQAPEAMGISDINEQFITELPETRYYNAIAIGSGIGLNEETEMVVEQLIHQSTIPLVIDADGINVIAQNKNLLEHIHPNSILTPHTKEFDRLTIISNNDYERLNIGIEFAKKYNIILVLKGAHTAVINSDGNVYFNSTGNPSLAKGATGDSLTGIIVANLAKGYTPLNAAILSVYVHGLAADICVKKQSPESVIAGDIIEALGEAFNEF